jgi:PAS domain S-box-containing protein
MPSDADPNRVPDRPEIALSDEEKEMAALYAPGVLTKAERDEFEARVENNAALANFTTELLELSAEVFLNSIESTRQPSADSKARVLRWVTAAGCVNEIVSNLSVEPHESIVITDPEGRLAWANDAFSDMCGYSFEDLRGKKPGSLLQGRRTDQTEVDRIRSAIRSQTSCEVKIFNYHKLGREYLVSIQIEPVRDHSGNLVAFVAVERELFE